MAAVRRGDLHALDPVFESDPVERSLVLHGELHNLFRGKPVDGRIGRLRADLEAFILGQEISLSFTPYKHKTSYMGVLHPKNEGIWEIRSRDPNPGIRVFGRFAEKDLFVALGWSLRSLSDARWPEKRPLGRRDSIEYQIAQIEVVKRWQEIIPELAPVIGNNPSEYFSRKYH